MNDWDKMFNRVADQQEAERADIRGENFLKELKGFCHNRGYRLVSCMIISNINGRAHKLWTKQHGR